jgi:hypothetical protein
MVHKSAWSSTRGKRTAKCRSGHPAFVGRGLERDFVAWIDFQEWMDGFMLSAWKATNSRNDLQF